MITIMLSAEEEELIKEILKSQKFDSISTEEGFFQYLEQLFQETSDEYRELVDSLFRHLKLYSYSSIKRILLSLM